MQWVGENLPSAPVSPVAPWSHGGAEQGGLAPSVGLSDFKVIRRNGSVVAFEPGKISVAMTKAFLAVNGGQGAASARVREMVDQLTRMVVGALTRGKPAGGMFHIEDIQDHVELALMRSGEHEVARAYVLYRERRTQERAARQKEAPAPAQPALHVVDGEMRRPLDLEALRELIASACVGLTEFVDVDAVLSETVKNIYDGVPLDEVYKSAILSARALIEKDPAYSQVTARLLLHTIRREVLGEEISQAQMQARYAEYFPLFVKRGVEAGLLDDKLAAVRPAAPRRRARRRARPAVLLSRPADAVRPLLPARAGAIASNCRRPSSCASRWGSRSTRSTARSGRSSSTSCSRGSIS